MSDKPSPKAQRQRGGRLPALIAALESAKPLSAAVRAELIELLRDLEDEANTRRRGASRDYNQFTGAFLVHVLVELYQASPADAVRAVCWREQVMDADGTVRRATREEMRKRRDALRKMYEQLRDGRGFGEMVSLSPAIVDLAAARLPPKTRR